MFGDFFRLADVHWGRLRLARNVREIFLNQFIDLRLIEVTGNRHDGIIGRVINAKELAHVLHRGCVQVFHRSNCRMSVRMVSKTHLEQAQESIHVRLVVVTQPFFFLYGFTLIVEILLRYFQ